MFLTENIDRRLNVVIGQPQSNLDFGPVVKPLGITVKKEVGKVVETSVVVRHPSHKRVSIKGQEPPEPKKTPKKGGPKNY